MVRVAAYCGRGRIAPPIGSGVRVPVIGVVGSVGEGIGVGEGKTVPPALEPPVPFPPVMKMSLQLIDASNRARAIAFLTTILS